MRERGLPLTNLARWMSQKPAELAGIGRRKGAIAAGFDADLVLFDPDERFQAKVSDLVYAPPFISLRWGDSSWSRESDVGARPGSLSRWRVSPASRRPGDPLVCRSRFQAFIAFLRIPKSIGGIEKKRSNISKFQRVR